MLLDASEAGEKWQSKTCGLGIFYCANASGCYMGLVNLSIE